MATILVLDGDQTTLDCLQDVLEAFGHQVLPTTTQEATMAVARGLVFDLFLVDIQVAGVDPVPLVHFLRGTSPGAQLIVVTDYPKDPATLAVLDAGADGTMKKPFEIGQIIHLLSGARP